MKRSFLWSLALILMLGSVTKIRAQQTINADFDSSGAVDFVDFSRLISQFGLVADSTRFQRRFDLNNDNAIDGEDAFLFADQFGNTTSEGSLTLSTGPNVNAQLTYEPTDNGFLVYLNNVTGIGGYRMVLSLPDSVKVRSVEDYFGIGLLPIRKTSSGVEIVGLVLGNQNLNRSGLLAGITISGDTTGVSIQSVSLRGKRVSLGNQLYLGDRNTISSTNIRRVPIGDLAVRPRYFDMGEIILGQTRSQSFDIVNTFNTQQALGAKRRLAFEISTPNPSVVVDPAIFGVLSDTSTGLEAGSTQKVTLKFTPTQTGVFRGIVTIKTNRPERPEVRIHVRADVRSSTVGNRVRAVANFDTLKTVGYDDFVALINRFGMAPDTLGGDLDKDGVVDGDDAFLFADLLGGFQGRPSYDTVRVVAGKNLASAVRVEGSGQDLRVSVRDLQVLGGYRLTLDYDPDQVRLDWAKDLSGGGLLPIRYMSSGAEVVGMGFGNLLEVPGDLSLAQLHVRALRGQTNPASLVRVSGVVFRGEKGERDSVGAVRIGGNGLDASPRVVDFGSLRLGATAQKTFRVFNLNSASTAFQITSSDSLVTTSPRSVGNLGGGRTWDVTVTYRSVAAGPYNATLRLAASDNDTSAVQIAVKAFGAVVDVSADSLMFADTFVGQQNRMSLTVSNPNLTDFEIQALRFGRSDTTFVVESPSNLPVVVAPEGGKQVVTVRFNPAQMGTVRDTLTLVGSDTTFQIPLTGRGLRRLATISATGLNFGNVDVGKDSTQTLRISNIGNVTFRLDSLRVGKRDTSFAYANNLTLPQTLAAGAIDTLRVRFRPDTTGAKRDTLRLYGQDTLWVVPLTGTGLPRPVIQPPPVEDVVFVTFGGTITKSRNEIHFGKVPWGFSDTAKVRVQNRRAGNLTFRFSTTDSQVVVKPDSVQNLPPNQEWDVLLTFTPKDSVQTRSLFQITTSETGDGTTSLVLKSGGSRPVLSDSVLSFGKLGVGNRIDKVVTVTNTGYSRLVLDTLALADSNFVLVNPPALPLSIPAEGGTRNFTVRFQPKLRGSVTGNLRFSGLDTSLVLPLRGIGRETILSFAPEQLTFGLLRVGLRDSLGLRLNNTGRDTVVLDSLKLVRASTAFAIRPALTLPDTLVPGTGRDIGIVFAPVDTSRVRDTLRAISGQDTFRAGIVGTGTIARASISSLSRNLGNLAVGRSKFDTISVRNTGNVPIAIQRVGLKSGQKGFALVSALSDTLGVQGTHHYIVRYQPDTTGSVSDTLQIVSTDTSFSVRYQAQGDPSITLTRTNSGITFTPDRLDFGNLSSGQKKRRIIRVNNVASTNWSFSTQIDAPGVVVRPSSFSGLPATQIWELSAEWTVTENSPKLSVLKVTTGDSTTSVPVGRNGAFARLLTDSLAFGDLRLGRDSTRFVRIRNTGLGTLHLQSVSLQNNTGFTLLSPPNGGVTLAENDSLRLAVRFRPQAAGLVTDTLRVVGTDTAFAVPMTGRGIQSVIALNRESLNFGQVVSQADSTQLLIIQNIGNGSFVLDSLKLVTQTSAFTFSTAPVTPSTILGGGDADTVGIRFQPPDLGSYDATLTLYGGSQVWTVPVTGRSNETGATVSGLVLSFGATVTRSDSVLHFGAIPFGATRKLSFTIQNGRDSTLTFGVASPNNQIRIESVSSASLLPNQTATVVVAFTPVVGGITSADLNVTTNAPIDGTVNIRVQKDRPPVSVSPLTLSFGSVLIGNSDTLKTSVLNPQLLNFNITQLRFVRGQAFALQGAPILPDTVRANGSVRTLTVAFAPKSRGFVRDTLIVTGNSQTFRVALSGTGLQRGVVASVDSLNFGAVDVGADSVSSFQVTNTGDVDVVLLATHLADAHFALLGERTLPDTLGVGQIQTFAVRYAPDSGGRHTAQVALIYGKDTLRVGLRGSGIAPPRVEAGPLALDLDLATGDQGARRGQVSGGQVAVDLAVTEGALGTLGFNVVVAFDQAALSFKEFVLRDLYDGATALESKTDSTVELSVAFLGGGSAPRDVGSAGQLHFTLLGNTDSTTVTIISAAYAQPSGPIAIEIGSEGARVVIGGTAERTADFDGDGEVGFSDFILFAGKFGSQEGQPGFDSRFDLDGDGAVGFPDFITFAGKFGTRVGGKPILTKPVQN